MGRMKDIYMDVMQNGSNIPEGATIGDLKRMQELQIFEWQEYEREKERARLQQLESENSGEASKISEIEQEFVKYCEKRERKKSKMNK